MLTHYLPLGAAEQMIREHYPDPRIVAARGSARPNRYTARRRVGRLIVRIGFWVRGHRSDSWPQPELVNP
jgi:hypothetical protein